MRKPFTYGFLSRSERLRCGEEGPGLGPMQLLPSGGALNMARRGGSHRCGSGLPVLTDLSEETPDVGGHCSFTEGLLAGQIELRPKVYILAPLK